MGSTAPALTLMPISPPANGDAALGELTVLPVQSIFAHVTSHVSRSFVPAPKWRNWQTRMVQVHVPARVWGFESLLRHQHFSNNNSQA